MTWTYRGFAAHERRPGESLEVANYYNGFAILLDDVCEMISDPTMPEDSVDACIAAILHARMERYANPDRCRCDGSAVDHSPDCKGVAR